MKRIISVLLLVVMVASNAFALGALHPWQAAPAQAQSSGDNLYWLAGDGTGGQWWTVPTSWTRPDWLTVQEDLPAGDYVVTIRYLAAVDNGEDLRVNLYVDDIYDIWSGVFPGYTYTTNSNTWMGSQTQTWLLQLQQTSDISFKVKGNNVGNRAMIHSGLWIVTFEEINNLGQQ